MIPPQLIIDVLSVHVKHPLWTNKQIAKELILSEYTVRCVFRNNMIHGRRKLTEDQTEYILSNLHLTIKELAININMSYVFVYNFLRKRGYDREKLYLHRQSLKESILQK